MGSHTHSQGYPPTAHHEDSRPDLAAAAARHRDSGPDEAATAYLGGLPPPPPWLLVPGVAAAAPLDRCSEEATMASPCACCSKEAAMAARAADARGAAYCGVTFLEVRPWPAVCEYMSSFMRICRCYHRSMFLLHS
jgi:hypothetical protein